MQISRAMLIASEIGGAGRTGGGATEAKVVADIWRRSIWNAAQLRTAGRMRSGARQQQRSLRHRDSLELADVVEGAAELAEVGDVELGDQVPAAIGGVDPVDR